MRVILHFSGSASATYVWVNGEKVGYFTDSRLPAEFDITDVVSFSGNNYLAVEVYKYSVGVYLEDQDFWRLSGIFRDVFLTAVPTVGIWDIYAAPDVNFTSGAGTITLYYSSANHGTSQASGYNLRVTVVDPKNVTVAAAQQFSLGAFSTGYSAVTEISTKITIQNVQLWSSEFPQAYGVLVELLDSNGEVVQAYRLPLGFRKLVANGNTLYYNNKKLKIRGVNRHEMVPTTGYTVPRDYVVKDLTLMKQAHVNFIRTCHYPNDIRLYEEANYYGLMILDECNLETHGIRDSIPASNTSWQAHCVRRMTNLIIRDRQFPCVVMWSLGNEAGSGNTFGAMANVTHQLDYEGRLCQYEGMPSATDLETTMYTTASSIASTYGNNSGKPYFLIEYCHAMGNSLGDIVDYWNMFYQYDRVAGGFIWDWVDQSLYKGTKPSEFDSNSLVYGGDFGDVPNDDNFCINGLIHGTRIPHPHYYELQKVYQPARFSGTYPNLRITNYNLHTTLSSADFILTYQIITNGEVTAEEVVSYTAIAPLETGNISLPSVVIGTDDQVYLNLIFTYAADTLWASKGDVYIQEQFLLNNGSAQTPSIDNTSALTVNSSGSSYYEIKGTNTKTQKAFVVRINKTSGLLCYYESDGVPLITDNVVPNFWRAPTDNDLGWSIGSKFANWKTDSSSHTLSNITEHINTSTNSVYYESNIHFSSTNSTLVLQQYIYGDGTIRVNYNVTISTSATNIPRVGLTFVVNSTLTNVSFYGRGPHENYLDRQNGSHVGTYSLPLSEVYHDYVFPQETGNRCDVRWWKMAGESSSLIITASGQNSGENVNRFLSIGASPYTDSELESKNHNYELTKNTKGTVVHVDVKQMGVGGDCSWGCDILDTYKVHPGNYGYQFYIQAN